MNRVPACDFFVYQYKATNGEKMLVRSDSLRTPSIIVANKVFAVGGGVGSLLVGVLSAAGFAAQKSIVE